MSNKLTFLTVILAMQFFACSYEEVDSERGANIKSEPGQSQNLEESQDKGKATVDIAHSGQSWELVSAFNSILQYHYFTHEGRLMRAVAQTNSNLDDKTKLKIEVSSDGEKFKVFSQSDIPVEQALGAKFNDSMAVFNDTIYWILHKTGGEIHQGDERDQYFMLSSKDGKTWAKTQNPFLGTACEKGSGRNVEIGYTSSRAMFFNCKGLNDSVTVKSIDGKNWTELQSPLEAVEVLYNGMQWRINDKAELMRKPLNVDDWSVVNVKEPLSTEANWTNQPDAFSTLDSLLYVHKNSLYAVVKHKSNYYSEPVFQLWKTKE